MYDLSVHISPPKESLQDYYDNLKKKISLVPSIKDTHAYAGFEHLVGGYDAGYYGYIWSEVYAKDLYSKFKNYGILSKEIGLQYRNWILEKGGSMDELELVKGFLEREPNNEAFIESLGLNEAWNTNKQICYEVLN